DAAPFEVKVTPVKGLIDGKEMGRIGLEFKPPVEMMRLPPLPAFRKALEQSADEALAVFHMVRNLLARRMPLSSLSGPIGIAEASAAMAQEPTRLLFWMAFISLQLG